MKKIILCFAMVLAAYSLHAQIYVDGKDVSADPNVKYLSIHLRGFSSDRKYYINVDYGQLNRNRDDNYLTNAQGEPIMMFSIIGAINYFVENGWDYADFLPYGGTTEGGRYLLKRK